MNWFTKSALLISAFPELASFLASPAAPQPCGIEVAPLPYPERQLIVVPPPAVPLPTFADVLGDVLAGR